jgi:hypothetical protein
LKGIEKPKTKNNYYRHQQAYSPEGSASPVPATPAAKHQAVTRGLAEQ